jgi:putative tryptophan/tyrosine transport system substrate-binding protein
MQINHLSRRDFVTLIGGATVAWPFAARAQQPKLPSIGALVPANPEPFWSEFRAGLSQYGYIEGQSVAFELRSARHVTVMHSVAGSLLE